jgi:hypothetical protein
MKKPLFHNHTYFLSNYFTVQAMSNDTAHEYMLLEEPQRKETNATEVDTAKSQS